MHSSHTTRPASGTDTNDGIPNSAMPLAMPANSDSVTAVFETSNAPIASAVRRMPKRSRMSDENPFCVTRPMRAADSCTTMSSSAMSGIIHSIL